jgi:hypothetical protein
MSTWKVVATLSILIVCLACLFFGVAQAGHGSPGGHGGHPGGEHPGGHYHPGYHPGGYPHAYPYRPYGYYGPRPWGWYSGPNVVVGPGGVYVGPRAYPPYYYPGPYWPY